MEPKTLLDTDVLSGLMRKSPPAIRRARSYLADHHHFTISAQGTGPPRSARKLALPCPFGYTTKWRDD